MEDETLLPVSTQTFEQVLNNKVAFLDPFKVRMEELKVKYAGLTITDINDKVGYEAVRVAIGELRTVRTGTAKEKAVIKKPYLEACDQIEEASKFIVTGASEIEDRLQKMKDDIDEQKEKDRQAKAKMKADRFAIRQQDLMSLGAKYADGYFTLDDVSYTIAVIQDTDEDVYEEVWLKFVAASNVREQLLEVERKKQQAADAKLEEDRKKLQEENNRLLLEQQQLKKQQDDLLEEQRKQKQQLWEQREKTINLIQGYTVGRTVITGCGVSYGTSIIESDESVFESFIANLHKIKVAYDIQKQEIADQVKKDLEAEILRKKKADDDAEAERKAEEMAKSSDKAQWEYFVRSISGITAPILSLKSKHFKAKAVAAKNKLNEIINL